MRTPAVEIVWHLWRLTRSEILYMTGTMLFIWGAMHLILPFALQFVAPILLLLVAMISVVTCLWTAGLDNPKAPVAFPLRRHFTQPVHTFPLVAITMLFTAVKTAVVFLAGAGFAQLLLGLDLPLAPVAALVAVAAVVIEALVWTPTTAGGRSIAYLLTVTGLLSGIVWWLEVGTASFAASFDTLDTNRMFLEGSLVLSAKDYGVLALVGLGALGLGTTSVGRQRQGESLLPDLRSLARMRPAGKVRPARAFTGPIRAQVWCETRRALSTAVPVGLGFVSIAVLLSVAVEVLDPRETGAVATVWLLQFGAAVLLGAVLAMDRSVNLRYRGNNVRLSAFDATLPIGNGAMSFIKTVTTAAGGAVSGLVVVVGAGIWLALHAPALDWAALTQLAREVLAGIESEFRRGDPHEQWLVGLVVLNSLLTALLWLATGPGLVMAGGLSVTRWMSAMGVFGAWFFGNGMLAVISPHMGWNLRPLQRAEAWALVIVVILSTAWLSYRAIRRGYVSKRVFAGAFLLWAGTAALWLYVVWRADLLVPGLREPALTCALIAALYCTPLAAVVLPSTVYAAYRHR